jgi:hypothetical protein
MAPITVKSKENWTGTDIANELRIVQEKLGTVIYAVTDGGSTLSLFLLKEIEIIGNQKIIQFRMNIQNKKLELIEWIAQMSDTNIISKMDKMRKTY